jgi:hypothetical protein
MGTYFIDLPSYRCNFDTLSSSVLVSAYTINNHIEISTEEEKKIFTSTRSLGKYLFNNGIKLDSDNLNDPINLMKKKIKKRSLILLPFLFQGKTEYVVLAGYRKNDFYLVDTRLRHGYFAPNSLIQLFLDRSKKIYYLHEK